MDLSWVGQHEIFLNPNGMRDRNGIGEACGLLFCHLFDDGAEVSGRLNFFRLPAE